MPCAFRVALWMSLWNLHETMQVRWMVVVGSWKEIECCAVPEKRSCSVRTLSAPAKMRPYLWRRCCLCWHLCETKRKLCCGLEGGHEQRQVCLRRLRRGLPSLLHGKPAPLCASDDGLCVRLPLHLHRSLGYLCSQSVGVLIAKWLVGWKMLLSLAKTVSCRGRGRWSDSSCEKDLLDLPRKVCASAASQCR